MGWQMHAYWLDRKAKQLNNDQQVASVDLGRGGGELPELLGLKEFDPDAESLEEAGTKVPKAKVEAAFKECCKKYLKGEDILWALHFLATILTEWKKSEKSIFFLME